MDTEDTKDEVLVDDDEVGYIDDESGPEDDELSTTEEDDLVDFDLMDDVDII